MNMTRVVPGKASYHTDDGWWCLLKDDEGRLGLLVDCEASFVSYRCLVMLNAEELRDYHGLGWLSIQHLANRINYFVDDYRHRRLVGAPLDAAIEAAR